MSLQQKVRLSTDLAETINFYFLATTDSATSTTVTTASTTSISYSPSKKCAINVSLFSLASGPTNDDVQGNSASMYHLTILEIYILTDMKFASATTVLLLMLAVLLFND